jgi:hypothetical protein
MKDWVLENIFSVISTIFGGGFFYAFISEKKKRKIELNKIKKGFNEEKNIKRTLKPSLSTGGHPDPTKEEK